MLLSSPSRVYFGRPPSLLALSRTSHIDLLVDGLFGYPPATGASNITNPTEWAMSRPSSCIACIPTAITRRLYPTGEFASLEFQLIMVLAPSADRLSFVPLVLLGCPHPVPNKDPGSEATTAYSSVHLSPRLDRSIFRHIFLKPLAARAVVISNSPFLSPSCHHTIQVTRRVVCRVRKYHIRQDSPVSLGGSSFLGRVRAIHGLNIFTLIFVTGLLVAMLARAPPAA